MSITSDEINFLIYRYLQENGFLHTAFTFAFESLVTKSSVSHVELPPGALITFLQKGLEYVGIEEHINEDGTIREFDNNYSLLSPFVCDLIATKEDRRLRKVRSKDSINQELGTTETINDAVIGNAAVPSTISLRREGGSKYLSLVGHQGEVFMCVWNPTCMQLASGSADGMCRLWGLWEMDADRWQGSDNSEQQLKTAILPHTSAVGERFKDVTSVSWSPDGKFLATGCYDGKARIWDSQGNLTKLLQEHTGPVFSLKWNKAGNLILSGSYDRRAIVWEAATGRILRSFMLHAAPVLDVDWKDSDTFATCSSDMSIHICRLSQEDDTAALKTFTGHTDEVNAVCWSPGGHFLASCSDDSTAKIWSFEEGLKYNLRGHLKEIYTIRWTLTGPSSQNPDLPLYVCTASFDGTVKVWSAATGLLTFDFKRHSQPVYSIAPSPLGDFLATGSLGGFVTVWSITDGSIVNELRGTGDTFDVSWSHDGSLLCSCFSSGVLTVLDASSWRTPQSREDPQIVHQSDQASHNVDDASKSEPGATAMNDDDGTGRDMTEVEENSTREEVSNGSVRAKEETSTIVKEEPNCGGLEDQNHAHPVKAAATASTDKIPEKNDARAEISPPLEEQLLQLDSEMCVVEANRADLQTES